jgi:DNA ligase-1
MKPMLASDYDESKLKFPLFVQPKIDGVRGLNIDGRLVGRSLKTHANKFTTARFSKPEYAGLDGELIVGTDPTAGDLCRATTSAVNRIEGEPVITWYVFDLITDETKDMNYADRYTKLYNYVIKLDDPRIEVVSLDVVKTLSELNVADALFLNAGYEGTIVRDPNGKHKQGRSTPKEGGLLRIKRFVEEEAVVLEIEEGQQNNNIAKTNELGRTERSTHQENMVPNGMVGSLKCRDVKTGTLITLSAGKLTHDERIFYFNNQDKLVGQTVKYKTFMIGVKDLPRFPTFQTIRAQSDIE